MVGGDTHFGDNYFKKKTSNKASKNFKETPDYWKGFYNLKALIDRSKFAFVNLETPLSPPTAASMDGKDYSHWTDPVKAGATLAKAGIGAVGLANNHAYDQGEPGLRRTLDLLATNRIAAFGAGTTLEEARAPLLRQIATPGGRKRELAIFGMFEERKTYRDKYGFYAGEHKPGVAPIDTGEFRKQVAKLRSSNPGVFIIAFPHWGENYAWANESQVALGHQLIDAGADIVIGQHGHTLQEIERYRDKWILYGIGNFLFNAPGRYDEHSDALPFSLVVELAFGRTGPPTVRLHPFMSDNKQTNYQPRPATVREAAAILSALQARPISRGLSSKIIDTDPVGVSIELIRTP